ncbi:MAG: hypothetical protein ABI891_12770 [Acidobacteriota bacterium]
MSGFVANEKPLGARSIGYKISQFSSISGESFQAQPQASQAKKILPGRTFFKKNKSPPSPHIGHQPAE